MKSAVKFFLKIALSLAILGLLLMQMDFAELRSASTHMRFSALTIGLAFILMQLLLLSLRWMYLVNVGRHRMNYWQSLKINLVSMVANTLFIATISGIAVRVLFAIHYGCSVFKAVFATALDRFMTLFALVFLSIICLPGLDQYMKASNYKEISIFIAGIVLCLVIMVPITAKIILKLFPEFPLTRKSIATGFRYMKLLMNEKFLFSKVIATSLTAQICFFLAVYSVLLPFDLNLSFMQVMMVLPIISLVSSIPFGFGGWGIREGAFMYGLGILGVPMEISFYISVQIGLLSLFSVILVGGPALLSADLEALKERAKTFGRKPKLTE